MRLSWGLVLPVLLAAAAILGLVIVLTPADPTVGVGDEGVTVDDVTDDPAAYEGRQVVIRGTVEALPPRLARNTPGAFVMAGTGGGRLLVVPDRPDRVEGLDDGRLVHVSGVVETVQPAADARAEEPPVTRGELLRASGADALVRAIEVAPAG